MKYLPLVWAGIWRKRSRAVLLMLQIVTAFLLFGTLQGLSSGTRQTIAKAHGDRLFVTSRISIQGNLLPLGLLSEIQSKAGVLHVTPQANLIGTFQVSDQSVPVIATNAEEYLAIHDEIAAAAGAVEALRTRRDGAIAGNELLRRYGWKVGDRIVLQSPMPKHDGSRDWSFDLVGTYDTPERAEDADSLITNFAYVNETRQANRDRVNLFVVQVDGAARAGVVGIAIDNGFASSDHETRTQSEADRLATQIQQIADIDYIVRAIVGAVFFALLLATGTLLMQSVRERESEFAVLKTFGFSDRFVLMLILAEALVLCLFAAGIGLLLAGFVLPHVRAPITVNNMPLVVVLTGLAFAALLALISGSAPALRGSRKQIVDALANR